MNLAVNFMVIKVPFHKVTVKVVAKYFFGVITSELKLSSQIIAVAQHITDHYRWAANRNESLCSLCVHVSSFIAWVGYCKACLTIRRKVFPTTSIMPFHNLSNTLNFSRGIRHQPRFLSTIGYLVVR